jgi:glucan phosphoethanolaminetransferase (alkaline phosphatase superfamily)
MRQKIRLFLIIIITSFVVWLVTVSLIATSMIDGHSVPSGTPFWEVVLGNLWHLYWCTSWPIRELLHFDFNEGGILLWNLFVAITLVYPIFCKLIFRTDMIKSQIWLYGLYLVAILICGTVVVVIVYNGFSYETRKVINPIAWLLFSAAYIYMFIRSMILLNRYKTGRVNNC